MPKLNRWTFLGLGLILPLVALFSFAACSDDDDGSSEVDAEAALCADLATLRAADADFDSLSSASTIEDVQDANDAYAEALDDVVNSANDLTSIRSQPIEDAYDDLDSAIDDLSGETNIADGLAAIEDELVAVDAAYATAFSGVTCP